MRTANGERLQFGGKYHAEIDGVDEATWAEVVRQFEDATIYQTWAYGAVSWGARGLSHVRLSRDGEVVSACQVRILDWPVMPGGIAYVGSGPMWRPKGRPSTPSDFQAMIRALRVCYGTERRLLVRVKVNAYDDVDGGVLKDAMVQEGFCLQPSIQPYRTLLVDLQRSADELRQSSRRTWRQALAAAERSKVALVEGVGSDLIEEAIRVYEEMRRRKRFAPVVDMRKLAGMQVRLPADQRIRVILASFQQETVGALAYSSLGDTGLPLLAATADKGIRINSSYVMWWRMLLEMKDLGCRWCDLGGIDPVRTPGTYVFRAGIAAKSSRDVRALGVFDFSASRLTSALVFLGTQAQQAHRRIRARASAVANRWRRPSRGSPRGGETA